MDSQNEQNLRIWCLDYPLGGGPGQHQLGHFGGNGGNSQLLNPFAPIPCRSQLLHLVGFSPKPNWQKKIESGLGQPCTCNQNLDSIPYHPPPPLG